MVPHFCEVVILESRTVPTGRERGCAGGAYPRWRLGHRLRCRSERGRERERKRERVKERESESARQREQDKLTERETASVNAFDAGLNEGCG